MLRRLKKTLRRLKKTLRRLIKNMTTLKRLNRELKDIKKGCPPGITAKPVKEDDLFKWVATIEGPEGTPYEGGTFHLEITFPKDYPFKPPKVYFKTKIYHPNVSSNNGAICLSVLSTSEYSPALSLTKLLLSISSFMMDVNANDPMNGEAGQLYLKDRKKYDDTVRAWTKKYAIDTNTQLESIE